PALLLCLQDLANAVRDDAGGQTPKCRSDAFNERWTSLSTYKEEAEYEFRNRNRENRCNHEISKGRQEGTGDERVAQDQCPYPIICGNANTDRPGKRFCNNNAVIRKLFAGVSLKNVNRSLLGRIIHDNCANPWWGKGDERR